MSNETANVAAILPFPRSRLVVEERAIPSPSPEEVLIRNHAIAINPIDWKRRDFGFAIASYPTILGTDVAGVVAKVGSAVTSLKPGDRVLGAAPGMLTTNPDNAAFQTYTLVPASAAAKLPGAIGFKQGATLATAALSATMALFDVLGLPLPHSASSASHPGESGAGILVWGGASSAGSATVQIARLAGLTVFATASPRHHAHVRSLGAAAVVDYRSPTAVEELVAAAQQAGVQVRYAMDAVPTEETLPSVLAVLAKFEATPGKKLTHLLPWPEQVAHPEGIETGWVEGRDIWGRRADLSAWLFNESLGVWLEKGEVVPQATRVVEGGVAGLQMALDELKKGVSGEKLVVEL